MLQIIKYTAVRTSDNKLLPQDDGKIIGTIDGNPEEQVQSIAEILFPRMFNTQSTHFCGVQLLREI